MLFFSVTFVVLLLCYYCVVVSCFSLKCQQGLLVEFSAFPQRFIDLLQQCITEQAKETPRFLLQLETPPLLDGRPAALNVIETNPFKHLTHLSLRLLPGNDGDVKKYLAVCLQRIKTERNDLEEKLHLTEGDLSKRLSITQQALAEKTTELDRLRSESSSQASELQHRHAQEITAEREKAMQMQSHAQHQYNHQSRETELAHQRATQHLQSRAAELDGANKELLEKKYKAESSLRELQAKLASREDEYHRSKQEVMSLRRVNASLDSECHEKDKLLNQLRTRTAVLEQEVRDKEQVVTRTTDVLETAQEHKKRLEDSVEQKQAAIGRLETTVKSLSEELLKANEIIKKLQGDVKKLVDKVKVKNNVTMQQEKLLGEREVSLQTERQELAGVKSVLKQKEEEASILASKLQEQLDATTQKLDESRQLLKTNENVISWLHKQLNESKMVAMQNPAANVSSGSAKLPNSLVSVGAGIGVEWALCLQVTGPCHVRALPTFKYTHTPLSIMKIKRLRASLMD
ncbi:SAS6 protein, partial [Amia calva]|nr:SAS6 protein [Amia calva]